MPGSLVGPSAVTVEHGDPGSSMADTRTFAWLLLLLSLVGLGGLLSHRVTRWVRVPPAAIMLVAAAVAVQVVPSLHQPPERAVERIVTVALVFILFEGGMGIGLTRLRSAAGSIAVVGVVGTFVTAAGVAVFCHLVVGLDWYAAALVATAVAPTDPAVVFSVLGQQEVQGRSGTLLEGESGANDPVGIALMASLISAGGISGGALLHVVGEFALQMGVGLAVGVVGGSLLRIFVERVPLPDSGLQPMRTIACVLLLFAVATLLHGSGFLAVFVAGVLMGEVRTPYRRELEHVHAGLASLGEVAAFVVLGLTVRLSTLGHADVWVPGLAVAVVLAVVVRPLLVGPLLAGSGLARNERWFVLLAGLKGAVPILLGLLLLEADVADPERLYGVVVVVVVLSVAVQGSLVPTLLRRLRLADPVEGLPPPR
ncbi:MAG TPA: cation:proton antiporter [Nocardioides sp.]|uniref:cation:proton antiporter domain-containing protein n=1 Tax=Nocardioides sp. TaxID=35761 RepID=UPI002E32949C|nr:cation:proton antiporter [Nocardioides sp.]HEX3932407.1 cation:proton antiporter [Nocardioides sp.]